MTALRRGSIVLVALVCGALLAQSWATARHVSVSDPNDTKGKLDVRSISVSGEARAPRWKFTTFARWSVKELWDAGWFIVNLDTFGGSRVDYQALVGSNGRRLRGWLIRDRKNGKDRVVRKISGRHPNARRATFAIGLTNVRRRGSGIYDWYGQTMFSSGRCRNLCFDRAPQRGRVTEPEVPEPTPTPTLPTPAP